MAVDESADPDVRADDATGIQVVARAAAILRVLGADDTGLSLGQIATRVGLPRSTVQRITGALQQEGLVSAASGKGLRIGPAIHALAGHGRVAMIDLVRPFLTDLSHRSGETVDLAMVSRRHLLFLDQFPGRHRLRAMSAVGETFPLTTTANGRACLALMADDDVSTLVRAEAGDDEGVQDAAWAAVRDARATGVAWDLDEHTVGVSAVGTAFLGADGEVYAISIPAPSDRFRAHRDEFARELLVTAGSIAELDQVTRSLTPSDESGA